eukprot:273950-Prymnesium_polylepis.1
MSAAPSKHCRESWWVVRQLLLTRAAGKGDVRVTGASSRIRGERLTGGASTFEPIVTCLHTGTARWPLASGVCVRVCVAAC